MFMVELVKAGSLGFAAACLVLSYSLLRKVMNSNDVAEKKIEVLCKEIRIFMCVSVLVIVIGIAGELAGKMLVPEINVRFDAAPEDIAQEMVVKAGGRRVDVRGEEVQVKDRDEVSLDLVNLDRKIKFLESRSVGTKNELNRIKEHQAKEDLQAAASTEEAGI
jgi:hypothetical protein